MTATLYTTSQGELDPECCASCYGAIASVPSAFVPYVTLPDPDEPQVELGYCLDCAVRHCCVTIEVRG